MTGKSSAMKTVRPLSGALPAHCSADIASIQSNTLAIAKQNKPADPKCATQFRRILLTGATGLVGRFFLHQLLIQQPKLIVYCLVRAASPTAGEQRLRSALQHANLGQSIDYHRVRILIGDISDHRFGMSHQEFTDLSVEIDAIYHLAAQLSLQSSYLDLRRANSFSINNVLELALTTRLKPVFFTSTMGVFPEYFCRFANEYSNTWIHDQVQPDVDLMKRAFPLGLIGYVWTKLVCEQALLYAHCVGLPTAIFRLPQTGSATTGYTHANDIVIRLISAANDIGLMPSGLSIVENSEPVDTLAKICISISLNPHREFSIYHCCEPKPVHYDIQLVELGIYLRRVNYPEFKRACLARGKESPLYGHWHLLDHFASYWFSENKPTGVFPVSDQAIQHDCQQPICWPNLLGKMIQSSDWINQPYNRWPYALPQIRLEPDLLEAQAGAYADEMKISFEDAYPDWLLQGMQQLVIALNRPAAELRDSRRHVVAFGLNRLLRENAALARERKQYPQIKNEQIRKPVFILGINRTGTTFLHRLLSRDPRFWSLKTYELVDAVIPDADYASVAGTQNDPRRLYARDYFDAWGLPQALDGIHEIEIDEPEEDLKLLNLAFASWTSTAFLRTPGYDEWLIEAGSDNAYHHHRQIMQHFNWQRREAQSPGRAKNWIFKMPFHLMELETLLKVYPDACFIQTHRAPIEFMGSWISLVRQMRSLEFRSQPQMELGLEQLNTMSTMMKRAIDFRNNHPELQNRWIDIDFSELVNNPITAVANIYKSFNWTLSQNAIQSMNTWIIKQTQHRKSAPGHIYQLSEFGLTPQMVNNAFDLYLEFYQQLKN